MSGLRPMTERSPVNKQGIGNAPKWCKCLSSNEAKNLTYETLSPNSDKLVTSDDQEHGFIVLAVSSSEERDK